VIESEGGQDLNHLSGYGKTKFLAEELVRDNTSIPSKYILRPRAIYGVYDKVLLPRLLKLVRGKQLIVPAHLAQQISLTHINNLVNVIADIMLNNKSGVTATYNIADLKIYSLAEVLPALLGNVTGRGLNLLKIPTWLWEGAVTLNEKFGWPSSMNRFAADSLTKNAVLNIQAATKDLSYRPQYTFEDSCKEIAQWVATQGGWKNYMKQI
jgi:nucleoside-diphosphate-sugar epimerase